MTVTIDKAYTYVADMKKARETAKEFKAIFTDGDLKRMLCEQVETIDTIRVDSCSNILKTEVEVFSGSVGCFTPHYHVTMFLYGYTDMIRLQYYMDEKYTIRPNCVDIEIFERKHG